MLERNTQETGCGIIAIGKWEAVGYGCPYCGHFYGCMNLLFGDGKSVVWICGNCHKRCVILADGVETSTIMFGDFLPKRQRHPLHA